MLLIGNPYIKREKGKSRLCSEIKFDEKHYEIYYEVDREYEEYLCFERADSFIAGLLPFAMSKGLDIVSEAPISERLYHQLDSYFVPTLAKYIYNNKISIVAESKPISLVRGTAVGTGISSGVDSFHTISTHRNLAMSKYNITHLTFFNVGSHGEGEASRRLYQKRYDQAKKLSQELNYELVGVNSNITDIINMNFVQTHTFRSFSAALALQKLFSTYYYSSGYPIEEFKISIDSSAYYDLMSASYLSTENIEFYSAGVEMSRLEKVHQISGYKPSYNYLNVCTRDDKNCGKCEKCIRTQLELYSINELGLYKNVFNLVYFDANLNSHMGFMLAKRKQANYREIIDAMRKNSINIPLISYIYAIKFGTVDVLKKIFKTM